MNTNSNLLSDIEVFIPNVNIISLTPKQSYTKIKIYTTLRQQLPIE